MDHVEADDHIRVLSRLEILIDLLLAVLLAETLETASDDFHGEEGE